MKSIILIVLFISSLQLYALETSQSSSSLRWDKLMKLITQEEEAIQKIQKKSDRLLYRLFELKTEKIKLFKESENQKFMQVKFNNKNISRKKIFKKTIAAYQKVKELGHTIMKTYPKTKLRASIYYTLALNSRDYAYDKQEKKYLLLALKHALKSSEMHYLASTALAEYYYNSKKYSKAIHLYRSIIQNRNDEWHTKNLYNYGWCLIKTKRFNKATVILEKAYHLSNQEPYINFKEQALNSLISFYVISNQVDRGVKFIIENEKKSFPHLFQLLKRVSNKGRYQKSQELISTIEKLTLSQKEQSELVLYELNFFQKNKEYNKMLLAARKLSEFPLSKDQQNSFIQTLTHTVGLFQITIKKDFTRLDSSYDTAKLIRIKDIFNILKNIDKSNTAKYEYFLAETLYSLKEYKKALTQYKKAFESSRTIRTEKDIQQKILKASLACLDHIDKNDSSFKGMLEYVYTNYIELYPKDKLAIKIYSKLYYFYIEEKNVTNAKDILSRYIQLVPIDKNIQKVLYRNLLDTLIQQEQSLKVAELITEMNKGVLSFSIKEVKKAENILATMLFKQYERLNQNGEYNKAVEGYKGIYFNDKYPKKIKADAAFNIGNALTNQINNFEAIKWYERSLNLLENQDKIKKRDYLEKLSTRMFLLQDFLSSAKLSKLILTEYCSLTQSRNDFTYSQSIRSDLANDYVVKALHTFRSFEKCTTGTVTSIQKEIIQHLYIFGHEKSLLAFLSNKKVSDQFNDLSTQYLKKYFWQRYHKNQNSLFLLKELKKYSCHNCKELLGQIKKLNQFKTKIAKFPRHRVEFKKDVSTEAFNQNLQKRILSFKNLTEFGNQLLNLQNPEISLLVLDQLVKLNNIMTQELLSITPHGNNDFREQFRQEMKNLSMNFHNQALSYASQSQDIMEKNEILNLSFKAIQSGKKILDLADIRTPASESGVTFDLTRK